MPTFSIKKGDTSPGLEYQLGAYEVGSALLAAGSVRFLMSPLSGGANTIDAAATIQDADGIVRYAWQVGDTAASGAYRAEFEVTYSDGTIESFPNDRWLTVIVTTDLG